MENYGQQGENDNNRHSGVAGLVISFICLSVIVVLVWLGHGDTSTKIFDPSSFYYGVHKGEEVPSPLEMHNRMVIVKKGQDVEITSGCNPKFIIQADDLARMRNDLRAPMVASNYSDIDNFITLSKDELNALFAKEGGVEGAWYCWKDATEPTTANYIISPLSVFEFVDYSNGSKVDDEHGIRIAIAPKGDSTRKLVFCNVVNWYCHLDSMTTFTGSHTSLLGRGDDDFAYGSHEGDEAVVLGLGNSATYMIYQKRDSADGEWYDCTAGDWYYDDVR